MIWLLAIDNLLRYTDGYKGDFDDYQSFITPELAANYKKTHKHIDIHISYLNEPKIKWT